MQKQPLQMQAKWKEECAFEKLNEHLTELTFFSHFIVLLKMCVEGTAEECVRMLWLFSYNILSHHFNGSWIGHQNWITIVWLTKVKNI